MKQATLVRLALFKRRLQALKKEVSATETKRISRIAIRNSADEIATMWVEELRSPLEHKFGLPKDVVESMASDMKQLHVLSRPNNLKTSYVKVINSALRRFDDTFVLPLKLAATEVETIFDLDKLVPGLPDPDESDYLREAIECAAAGHKRAAIVLGWCAAIDKIQKKLVLIGLEKFNAASASVKAQTSGKFKNWNKQFDVENTRRTSDRFRYRLDSRLGRHVAD